MITKKKKASAPVTAIRHDAALGLIAPQRAVWLAGPGALARANATTGTKGEKAFEMLVKMDASFEASARGAIDASTGRLKTGVNEAAAAPPANSA